MKKYTLVYSPAAIEHIRLIASWYNQQKKGLGKRFKDNLKKETVLLKLNPFTHSCRYDKVRYAIPDKFPYAAHYTVDELTLTVIIHAVFAFKENPQKWVK
jgi:toxin ParE1/3/4